MPRYDQPRTDRQPQRQGARIVELIEPVAQIASRRAHRRLFLHDAGRLLVRLEFVEDLPACASFEPLLLGAPPLLRSARPAARRGRAQVFAGVVVIHKELLLLAEAFPAREPDPLAPIGDDVNLTLQAPASLPRAVAPASAHRIDVAKSRAVGALHPPLRPRGHQAHLFPLPRPFVFSAGAFDRANHRPIGLRDDLLRDARGQRAKAPRISALQARLGSRGVPQRGLAHRARMERKTVVLQEPLTGLGKGMLGAEVGEHPLQTPGAPAVAHADARGEDPQVALLGVAPNPFLDFHRAETAGPSQRFFYRSSSKGSFA